MATVRSLLTARATSTQRFFAYEIDFLPAQCSERREIRSIEDFVICLATRGGVYEQARKSGSISPVFTLLLQG